VNPENQGGRRGGRREGRRQRGGGQKLKKMEAYDRKGGTPSNDFTFTRHTLSERERKTGKKERTSQSENMDS